MKEKNVYFFLFNLTLKSRTHFISHILYFYPLAYTNATTNTNIYIYFYKQFFSLCYAFNQIVKDRFFFIFRLLALRDVMAVIHIRYNSWKFLTRSTTVATTKQSQTEAK